MFYIIFISFDNIWLQHKSNDLKEMGDIYLDIVDYYESGDYLSDFR